MVTRRILIVVAFLIVCYPISACLSQGAQDDVVSYLNAGGIDSLSITVKADNNESEMLLTLTRRGAKYRLEGISGSISVVTEKLQNWKTKAEIEIFRSLLYKFLNTEAYRFQELPGEDSLLCEVKLQYGSRTYVAHFGNPARNEDVAFLKELSEYVYTLREAEPPFPQTFPPVMIHESSHRVRRK